MAQKLVWNTLISLGLGLFSLLGIWLAWQVINNPLSTDTDRVLTFSLILILLFHFAAFFTFIRLLVFLREKK